MACMNLDSKEDMFRLDGRSWLCATGPPSDVFIEVRDTCFHLHKVPLMSRSRLLEKLIKDFSAEQRNEEEIKCNIALHDLPGGAKSFLLIVKFCYGVKFELTAADAVYLRCAAEFLEMTKDCEDNLISWTEDFLDEVLTSWSNTITAIKACESTLPLSEELHIISMCINSLADKICSNWLIFNSPMSGRSPATCLLNGKYSASERCSPTEDWWYEDVSILNLPLFKSLMQAVSSKGMPSCRVAESVMFYARRHLPLNGRHSNYQKRILGSTIYTSISDQRTLVEEIVELLPNQKGVTPTDFLLKLLKTSMILNASKSCRETLERRIGAQLDQAVMQDLLIPNTGSLMETLYDIECVQRIVDHFLFVNQDDNFSDFNPMGEVDELLDGSRPYTPLETVANLLDSYLAEVAPDANLKLGTFILLASLVPDYARPLDDGIYHAIDLYLEAHPWLTDSEREQLCCLMDGQKLSSEACAHATQNKRLPVRFIAQVLFIEQLHLRTSVAGWLYVTDQLEASRNLTKNLERSNGLIGTSNREGNRGASFNEMRERVSELEKQCGNMKIEIEKIAKNKGGGGLSSNFLCPRFYPKSKMRFRFLKLAFLPCSGEADQLAVKEISDK